MDFRADLHIHSYFSDGTCSPEEILYLAKEKNLLGISITDHDSVEAYSKSLFGLAKKLNIKLVVGAEISSELLGVTVHILAYNIDLSNEGFRKFLKQIQEKRNQRNLEIIRKLNENAIDINQEELHEFTISRNISQTVVGRVHIAKLLCEKGYVNSIQQAFDLYIRDNGPCYVPGHKFLAGEVIEQVHLAKAKAVIAHPNLIKNSKVIDRLIEMNIDGIEIYYAKLIPAQENRWLQVAQKHNLLVTGGSDFHGEIKPYITLGCSWVDETRFNQLTK